MTQRPMFQSYPLSVSQFHPFRAPGHFSATGIILGVDLKTGKLVYMDPWRMKHDDIIDAPTIAMYGLRGFGKSTLLKDMTPSFLSLIYKDNGVLVEGRGQLHSRKRLKNGDAEEKPLMDLLGGDVMDMSQFNINYFDPRMNLSELDLVRSAFMNCELVNGQQPLSRHTKLILQVGIAHMLDKTPALAHQGTLLDHVSRVHEQKILDYYSSESQGFRESLLKGLLDDKTPDAAADAAETERQLGILHDLLLEPIELPDRKSVV